MPDGHETSVTLHEIFNRHSHHNESIWFATTSPSVLLPFIR